MEPAPAGGTVGGNKLPFWAIKSAEKWEFVEVRGTNSEGRIYSERSEPNSEPPHGGGSVIARRVSAGYPGGEILEPRVRGGRKPRFGVWASLKNKVLCILLCGGKSQYRSLVLCRPTGAPILLYSKPDAYASGY